MEAKGGIRFVRPAVPTRLEKNATTGGRIRVTWTDTEKNTTQSDDFDTVLFAIGRDGQTASVGLDRVGMKMSADKIVVNDVEQTSVPNIFAVGDCILDRPELTPVAIKAGQLLARRLFAGASEKMNYNHIPTTVFTPYEYGTVGLSEEAAIKALGAEHVETWLSRYGSLEVISLHQGPTRPVRSFVFHQQTKEEQTANASEELSLLSPCLAKLVCDRRNGNRVIGFHYVGPNAGEITQGFAVAIKMGATKDVFDSVVGIHPTSAEEFCVLDTTRSSGASFIKKAGCGGGSCG
jgi:thioredoxin reductase (NADPH)